MKKLLGCLAALLIASTVSAENLWRELDTTRIYNNTTTTTRHQFTFVDGTFRLAPTYRYTTFMSIDRYRDVGMNLDNTLFGRAHKIANVDTTAQVKTAWEQGYTGNRRVIGVLGDFGSRSRQALRLQDVNTSQESGVIIKLQHRIERFGPGGAHGSAIWFNRQFRFRSGRYGSNRGGYERNLNLAEMSTVLAGGKHDDWDGTMLAGIAKDAIMRPLDINQSLGTLLASQVHLDYISSNLVSGAPSTQMATAYTAISNSGRYGAGNLPLFISPAGDSGVAGNLESISAGTANAANYVGVEMALSTQRIGGKLLSDYLVIAGGVVDMGNGAYAAAGNTPGDVVALQNRWLVAPYTFRADGNDVSGTALSAAFVSGVAAIVNDKFPRLTSAEVGELLLDTARDLGADGTDGVYGRGMVDLNNALSPQ